MADDRRVAFRATVHGRVQGVGFRYYVRQHAVALGLGGWVGNNADGTVSLHYQGTPQAAQQMQQLLWEGPPFARVTAVEVVEAPEVAEAGRFRMRS